MAMPAWMPEAWNRLSTENQKKAENIIQVLLNQLSDEQTMAHVQPEESKPKKTRVQFDVLKGRIRIADNFDDPLPEFEEYMQ